MTNEKQYCGSLTLEWLNDYPKGSRNRYKARFRKALEWLGMTDSEIVSQYKKTVDKEQWRKKWGQKVKAYYNFLLKEGGKEGKGLAVNTARADISGLRAFLSFHCMAVKIKKGAIPKPQPALGEHHFTQRELQRMFAIGDARDKAILSSAVCLGWGYQDFSQLETQFVKNLIANAKQNRKDFPSFDYIRKKTNVRCRAHLTPESMESLELWFKVRDKESVYAFPNGNGKDKPIRNETLNDIIKRLVKEANIVATGKIKFHCVGRKFLMNAGSSVGLNEFQLKFLVAKEINVSDETYLLLKNQIDEKFPQVYEHIRLNGDIQRKAKEHGQLEGRIVELESKLEDMARKNEQRDEWRKDILFCFNELTKALLKAKVIKTEKISVRLEQISKRLEEEEASN